MANEHELAFILFSSKPSKTLFTNDMLLYASLFSFLSGIVRNVVQGCMFRSVCMETCKWTPICDSKLKADIMVRNCGDFHVYYLTGAKLLGTDQQKMPNSPTRGVYCSDNMRTNTEGT